MSLFKRKSKSHEVSVFDSVPPQVLDTVILDVIAIIRLVKAWPTRMFPDRASREKAGEELQSSLRRVGVAAAGIAMTMGANDDEAKVQDIMTAFAKLPIPTALRPLLVAAYTTFVEE